MEPPLPKLYFLHALCLISCLAIPATAQSPDPVRLGPGDELTFRFQGRDTLDGPYVIGVDGKLFFPGIGEVAASGRTVTEVAADLDVLMRSAIGLDARTFSISVSEFRPVYVGGRVQQPGAYTFRPGLRVAQAIAMAGGSRGLGSREPILALEQGREYARLRVIEDQLADVLLRRDRLRAALDLLEVSGAGIADPVDLIGAEETADRATLQARLTELEDEIDRQQTTVLDRRAESARGEVTALEAQLSALREVLDISAEELANLEEPGDRGLVPRSRILELRRIVAAANGEISATLARRFGAESNERAFAGDSELIALSRRVQDVISLSQAEAEIGILRRQVVAVRSVLDDLGGLPSRDGETCGIEIWRDGAEGLAIIPVEQTFALQPGDFVRLVERTAEGTCDRQAG